MESFVIFGTVNKAGALVVLTSTNSGNSKMVDHIIDELRNTLCPPGTVLWTRLAPVWPVVLEPNKLEYVVPSFWNMTTSLFWTCNCSDRYIHPSSKSICPRCLSERDGSPDVRVDDVLRNASRWSLDESLVNTMLQRLTNPL